MRLLPRALLAGGLGFAVAFIVACGGGGRGLLSGGQSNQLNRQLDAVSSAVNAHNCVAAQAAAAALGSKVGNLPVTVNPTLRGNLAQGVSTVAALAAHDCHTTTTHSTTSTTTPTSTSTSTSTTTPTSTTTTTTSTSTSTTSTTTPSTTTNPATSTTTTGTTSTTGGTGGAGLGGGSGGAGPGNPQGNGNGSA